jgi:hypothetical protein
MASIFAAANQTGGCFPGPHPFVPDLTSWLLLPGMGLAAFARQTRR